MDVVLFAFPCGNVYLRMEPDLAEGDLIKHPIGVRRRTRSTGSLPCSWSKASGDSSSSVGEWDLSRELAMSSLHQSDSEEVSGRQPGGPGLYNLHCRPRLCLFPSIESDSVNENFSPIRPTTRRSRGLFKVLRRKRKLKRMALEMSSAPPTTSRGHSSGSKKKRIVRSNCENRLCCSGMKTGKRKRSSRSMTEPPRTVLALHRLSLRDDTAHQHSSSSLSSSESDTGIYTNDEGREGDDEQSDWVGEGASGGRGASWEDSDRGEPMEDDLPQAYTLLAQSLTSGRSGREIRGGRRRVRSDRASFSVLTSANEKLSRFLQDPDKSQLRLHPMREQECHQLGHLADLYSLDMRLSDHSNPLTCPVPILTKTSKTVRGLPVCLSRLSSLGEIKRRRRTPPSVLPLSTDVEMGDTTEGLRGLSSQDSSLAEPADLGHRSG